MTDDAPEDARKSKAPAIARAVAILRLLGKSETPLGVQAIARALGLVPSTCLYVLRALVDEGLVSFDPSAKRYRLEAGVLTLARAWLKRDAFNDHAQPVLDRLAQTHGATMLGVQIVGLDHMIVVSMAQSGRNFRLSAEIGGRFPALISATGRCIAAFGGYPEAELKRRFSTLRWDHPPSFETWLSEVKRTRTKGYAVDDGAYLSGVTVLSAPVWKTAGAPSHALVAIAVEGALPRSERPALGA
ncbi:MAG: IclR family transcriptional regulator, partial [Parvularculaceae bacterium]|nr:IclR family transcriptional regulator [Parvularculaceae bacterium]